MEKLLNCVRELDLLDYRMKLEAIIHSKTKEIYFENNKGIRYGSTISDLPEIIPSVCFLNEDTITVGASDDLNLQQKEKVFSSLKSLMPWRKGPFRIFGTYVDSEWVSYKKWNRLKDKIESFKGKRVLDIGSSCGYYMFRIADALPNVIIGIEPYLTFYFQYQLLQHFMQIQNVHCLPLRFDEIPVFSDYFDTVLCMGVLYHQRSPQDMLSKIRSCLKKDGELILETLIIEGDEDIALCPKKKYAKMNNVYFIPTVSCLENWLQRAGFREFQIIDISATSVEEQRKTEWIQTESLSDFLSPLNTQKTVEGYPAPIRAVVVARRK